MVINEQLIDLVKFELANLKFEKGNLEQKIKSVDEDIFALEHLLNRVNIKVENIYTSNNGMIDDTKIIDDEDIIEKVENETKDEIKDVAEQIIEESIVETTNGAINGI